MAKLTSWVTTVGRSRKDFDAGFTTLIDNPVQLIPENKSKRLLIQFEGDDGRNWALRFTVEETNILHQHFVKGQT